MLKLHHSPTSPYVRKVVILLYETGQLEDVELVYAMGTPLEPGSLPVSKNPLGKIPALERPDGPALFDSRVICQYLDHRAGGKLYPKPPQLWDTMTLEAAADGILDAALLMVYEARLRPEDIQFPDWVDSQWAKITRTLDALETQWADHLNGPLDMGQIAVGSALGYLDFRHNDRDWRNERSVLSDWYSGFSARSSMQATMPPT